MFERTFMQPLSIEQLAQTIGASRTGTVGRAACVTGVSTDSRTIRPGDGFFALVGERFDGHDHVEQAFAGGAACAVVSRTVQVAGPTLNVADTVAALGHLARAYRRMHPFRVVAITGSVGKTTTRQMVHHVLSQHFRARQARQNFNNAIGLPLTVLEAKPEDEILVVELGANHPGEIAYLTRIAQPEVAVVTNVHPAHLEGFGDLATIVREKLSIAEGLSDDGILVVNGDIEPLLLACRQGVRPFLTFGRSLDARYRAEHLTLDGFGSTFTLQGRRIHLSLPGPGNVENALAAWAVCDRFGLTIRQFAQALPSLSAVAMRAEPVQIGTLTVLNDCYNANPASMANALAILRSLRSTVDSARPRRLVFVCGEMAELGSQTSALHAQLGQAVADTGVAVLLTVGRSAATTAEVAKQASRDDLQTACFDDTRSLCERLKHYIRKDDVILVKGSRTARLECVVERLGELFATPQARCRLEDAPAVRHVPQCIRDRETG